MSEQSLIEVWQEPVHADSFDAWTKRDAKSLGRFLEAINEFRLFCDHKNKIHGRDFVEIGCATGEVYRYLRGYHSEFRYRGFDISRPAVERACQKYPDGRFDVCKPDLSDVIAADLRPSVVWRLGARCGASPAVPV